MKEESLPEKRQAASFEPSTSQARVLDPLQAEFFVTEC